MSSVLAVRQQASAPRVRKSLAQVADSSKENIGSVFGAIRRGTGYSKFYYITNDYDVNKNWKYE
jgi:hypothetical protein